MPPRTAVLLAIWPGASRSRVGPTARCSCRQPPWVAWRRRIFRSSSKARRLMSKAYRRYEILLPLRFNDGLPVPEALVGDTLFDLRQRFGAVSCETQTIRGNWQHTKDRFFATI